MPEEETGADEEGVEETQTSLVAAGDEVTWSGVQTSLGWWDGTRFYLRNFAVWYRWTECASLNQGYMKNRQEEGVVDGVNFVQSMGRIQLTYDLIGSEEQLTDQDLTVELSCWELKVSKGSAQNTKNLPKINALTGELYKDVRVDLSWWEIVENDEYWPGRHLVISLAKLEHSSWQGIWFKDTMNPHKKTMFGWSFRQVSQQEQKKRQSETETLAPLLPGAPQELEKDLCTAIPPDLMCTGTDFKEDDTTIHLFVHLDEEKVELAAATCPMEEIFSADVENKYLEVSLRGDGFGIVWGALAGSIIPEATAWEICSVRRDMFQKSGVFQKEFGIKCPAFYNKALQITMTKAPQSMGTWGKVFEKMETPGKFAKPVERISWTERVQRALVLAPTAPMNDKVKAEKALKLCTEIETSQDNVLHRAYVTVHLEDRLEEYATKFQLDLSTNFFITRVSDGVLELIAYADNEFTICMGKLGGNVIPEKTNRELIKVGDHLAIKISLTKARDAQVPWDEVFVKCKPWELVELEYQKLQALEN
jgi:hypothetical protein